MTTTGKILAWTCGLGIVGFIAYKLTQTTLELKAFYDQLSFEIQNLSIKVVKKESKNILKQIVNTLIPTLQITFDIKFTNPTKTSIELQKPVVKILYNGNELARSAISTSNNKIRIEKENVSYARNFVFDIDLQQKFSVVFDMVSKIASGIQVDNNATLFQKAGQLASGLTSNVLTKLLPLIDVNILIYAGNTPIDYTTKLV